MTHATNITAPVAVEGRQRRLAVTQPEVGGRYCRKLMLLLCTPSSYLLLQWSLWGLPHICAHAQELFDGGKSGGKHLYHSHSSRRAAPRLTVAAGVNKGHYEPKQRDLLQSVADHLGDMFF